MAQSRIEPRVTPAYRKDSKAEAFLKHLNAILAPYQEQEYEDLPELFPTLHIIGVPRSGTTLLSQLIATHLDVGYINNLIAAFWQAPLYGIRLSKKLLPRQHLSSFQSEFGRTSDLFEPHEFGYFWSSLLGYRDMLQQGPEFEDKIDWHRLKLILTNINHEFGCPTVYKSFLVGWHIAKMQNVLPSTCFVRIRREPTQNAISILKMRKKLLGSVTAWNGLKPIEYLWLKDEPYWKQVAGQVYYVDKSLTEQIEKAIPGTVLEVKYEELCHSPQQILEKIIGLLANQGSQVQMITPSPDSFQLSFENVDSQPEFGLVAQSICEFYGQ